MDRSKSIKLDTLAEVCSKRLADEYLKVKYLDLMKDLKSTHPLNFPNKKRTRKAEKIGINVIIDKSIVLLGKKRRRMMIDIHEGQGKAYISKPNYAPDMPKELRDLIREKRGYDVKLIIEKELYDTDVKKAQNRLSMPLKQILSDDFLNQKEKTILSGTNEQGRKPNDGVVVGLVEPCLEETTMTLKKRDFTSTSSYVLINNWHGLVERNGLVKGDTVRAWFFRVNDRPWIALVKSS
ncbi:hypothetical protein L484_004375 [Morus notabilis]|uniref:B3 domain-containing protein n=1 Tax=Morus notabilis TaxID=981085 RepID=W9RLF1_9ROSA|nr:putative B3 domain-containing protein At3g24850 [Morus notabilis]EXB80468.1 hypothetical protein L484_004375 [Morus notabilis]